MSFLHEDMVAAADAIESPSAQLQIAAQFVEAYGVGSLGQPPAEFLAVHPSPAYMMAFEHAEPQ